MPKRVCLPASKPDQASDIVSKMPTNAEKSVPPGKPTGKRTGKYTGKHTVKHTVVTPSKATIEQFPPFAHPVGASQTFAKIIPANEKARNAFHQAILYLNEDSSYHKQFVAIDSSPAVDESSLEYSDNSDTEYDTDFGCHSLSKDQNLHGAFKLSLQVLPVLNATAGWRIGKGSSKAPGDFRGIEILLVRPGQREAKRIAAVHASIQLHADSGAFVLTAGSNKPIWFYLDNEEIKLQNSAQIVLSKPTNRFRVGELEYNIKFDVSDMTTFVQDRNGILQRCYSRDPPHPKLDAIPQPNHQRLGHAIIHNSLGYGGTGWVYIGIDSVTGHPLAVKELRVRRKDYTMKSAEDEVAISRRFKKKHRGILQTLQTWCEHGNKLPCGKNPERVYISSTLSRGDFSKLNWNIIPFLIRLSLLKDTLTGLNTLHKQGLMHRDITVKNLLLVTLSPPEAALCDFGTTIEAEESSDTAIGPKCTLAPEVWGLLPYNNKVDVWSLAFAWVDTFKPGLPRPEYIDCATHRQIYAFIQSLLETRKILEQFAILLRQMLSWDPRERLSSEEALKHPCWNDISNLEQHKNKASPQKASPQKASADSRGKRKSRNGSPERTTSASEDSDDDDGGNGKFWLEFHKERQKQRAQPGQQTNQLLRRR